MLFTECVKFCIRIHLHAISSSYSEKYYTHSNYITVLYKEKTYFWTDRRTWFQHFKMEI